MGRSFAIGFFSVLVLCATARAGEGGDLGARIEAIVRSAGPRVRLRELRISDREISIGLEVDAKVALGDLPPDLENAYETAIGAIAALRPEVRAVHLLVAHPNEPLRPPPRMRKAPAPKPPDRSYSVRATDDRFPFGRALLGRTIALSPGHGYIYYDSLGRFSTQRGLVEWNGCGGCRGIVEDFETHEIAVRYLVPLLEGAGARVVLVRERDYGAEGAIVDDGEPGYSEDRGTFSDGNSEGGHQSDYRTSSDASASASFTLRAPRSGPQLLSLWFVHGANRLPSAELTVEIPRSSQAYLLDLVTHGRRWAPIGVFDLSIGDPVVVRVSAPVAPGAGGVLVADAARLGAGTHESGHPWWRMGASPYAGYQEAGGGVQSYGDVTIRPRFAEWLGADVYVSIHSNASGQSDSTAAGTSSYRYNCGAFPDHSNDPAASSCDDPAGSDRLQEIVHRSLVEQLERDWDPAWIDRGTKVANFGELRELDGIPGVLLETAFHDNVRLSSSSALRTTDNQSLHDPRWRRAAAFGIYRGISEFLVGPGPLVAGPPVALAARRIDRSSVELSFSEVPEALAYRVYAAIGGRAFDQGRLVQGSPALIAPLPEGTVASFAVASVDAAGEGPRSRVVSARPSARASQVLIVDAFDREDAWVQEVDNLRDTAMVHGLALSSSSVSFDSATESALESGLAALEGYDGAVLALGRESTEHGVLTPSLRDKVQAFNAGGGAVFASGSEIAWALDAVGDDGSRAFLAEVFAAAYSADDAGEATVSVSPGGWLDEAVGGRTIALAGDGSGLMAARSSDVLAPLPGGIVELAYGAGSNPAAVRKSESLLVGVALDSFADGEDRARLLGAWVERAIPLAPIEPEDPAPDAGLPPDVGDVDSSAPDAGEPPPEAAPAPIPSGEEPPVDELLRPRVTGGCRCLGPRGAFNETGGLGLFLLAIAQVALLPAIVRRRRPRPA